MVVADTGFWLALANARDRHHARAVAALDDVKDEALVVTWPVVVETCHLLSSRIGPGAQERWLRGYSAGAFAIADAGVHPPEQMLALMVRYRDLPMDATDASLVLLAGDLGHGRILSTDLRDFRAYRWKNRHPFENLLLGDGD